MNANRKIRRPGWVDEDEIPDPSTPEWQAAIARAPVQRGRPKLQAPKVSTTIPPSPEVIAHVQKDGPGWQSRIDAALRKLAEV